VWNYYWTEENELNLQPAAVLVFAPIDSHFFSSCNRLSLYFPNALILTYDAPFYCRFGDASIGIGVHTQVAQPPCPFLRTAKMPTAAVLRL
jgi:hypothetical protein